MIHNSLDPDDDFCSGCQTSVNVTTNSHCQDYTHPDDHTLLTLLHDIIISSNLQISFPRKSPTFNKEVYVDFVAAQIKTLSFLAYIIRIYQDMVNTYSQNMVGGMLGLLRYCPQEVAHLRKELLIAARHILATDLRNSE